MLGMVEILETLTLVLRGLLGVLAMVPPQAGLEDLFEVIEVQDGASVDETARSGPAPSSSDIDGRWTRSCRTSPARPRCTASFCPGADKASRRIGRGRGNTCIASQTFPGSRPSIGYTPLGPDPIPFSDHPGDTR